MATEITLQWAHVQNGCRALVFDPATWAVFEKVAGSQGKTAQELIVNAVSGSLGTVMVDNYKLNRWLNNDDPEFFRR